MSKLTSEAIKLKNSKEVEEILKNAPNNPFGTVYVRVELEKIHGL